jgi:TRAP-type C4-dicarboxylate transport system substrate-binding protein
MENSTPATRPSSGHAAIARRTFITATGAAAVTVFSPAFAQAKELRVLSGFQSNLAFTREILRVYLDSVQKTSNGSISARVSGPEVVPFADQFQPAAAGAFDILFTHPAYHSGTTAMGLAVDAIAPDAAKRRSSGVFDLIDRHYNTHGLKLLAITPTGARGYQFVSKHPIKGSPGLAGMKVRATLPYHPMVKALGGVPVVMGGGEVYSALEKGVIDAAAWGLTGVANLKWDEVAKYLVRPTFGSASMLLLMNQKSWAALTPAEQKILSDEAQKIEAASLKRFNELNEEEEAELRKKGMQVTSFSAAEAGKLDELWAQGVWEVAKAKNGATAEELRTVARKAGLTV